MELTERDLDLIGALCEGLPLDPQPYAALGRTVGMEETEVLHRLEDMVLGGVIRRLGVIVRHHELGYRANAMVVWDVPDSQLERVGNILSSSPHVTLCYARPRRLPDWPYNLFTMVHGKDQPQVRQLVEDLAHERGVQALPHDVLFSLKRYKQCGARYGRREARHG